MDWILVLAGLTLLVFGGDWLVKGAVALSIKMGISALVVSLTVVAIGTSAPELLIAVEAGLDGIPELALGNVIGSNTANVLLVLGVPALISGIGMSECKSQRNYYYMIAASVFFTLLCLTAPITYWQGSLMLAVLAGILWMTYRQALTSRRQLEALESEVDDTELPNWKIGTFLLAGLVALPLGANFLITGSVNIAKAFGVSEAVIGLTLVAVGTSLPELATTVMAGIRRQTDVVIGNVLGSNMFNLLAIIGVASFVAPIPVSKDFFTLDLPVMLGSSLILAPFLLMRRDISRIWGVLFVTAYVVYIAMLLSGHS